jgi:UDP-glucuronate 4-epimerase
MRQVLVTGGAGFIGSHCCERLLERGDAITVLDKFDDFYDPALKRRNVAALTARPDTAKRFRVVEGDIRDAALLRRVFDQTRFDAVLHLAAMAGVRPSLEKPALYFDVNVTGTSNLLEETRRTGVRRFVFGSSSSVYGVNENVPFREDDPVEKPISPYAVSKRCGELLAFSHHRLYGTACACLRFFTVYGPRQRPEMAIHRFASLIDAGKPITLYGDGGSRRDYTYVSDIVDGAVAALDRIDGFRIYNLGESRTVELRELVELLEAALGKKAVIDRKSDQPGDVPITFADVSRARAELDYRPQVPIEEGIRRFVAWFRAERAPRAPAPEGARG